MHDRKSVYLSLALSFVILLPWVLDAKKISPKSPTENAPPLVENKTEPKPTTKPSDRKANANQEEIKTPPVEKNTPAQPVPVVEAPAPRTGFIVGGGMSPGFASYAFVGQNQYRPLFLFQIHAGYDLTKNQCASVEKRDSVFCIESTVLLQTGFGYVAWSEVPFFRLMAGLAFDFYFGKQRTVALTLTWKVGYGYYGFRSNEDQQSVAEQYRILETENRHRLEWELGPGVLVNLDRLYAPAKGVSLYGKLHFLGTLNWGFVTELGAQYRF